jgi:hypothetical protein
VKILAVSIALAVVLIPSHTLARHRTHVVIHKRPPAVATQPAAVPVALIPPLAILYDLARRTSCDGDVLGMGGPGFDSNPVGNYLTPAIHRSACAAQPK